MIPENELRKGSIVGTNDSDFTDDKNEIHFISSISEILKNEVLLRDFAGNSFCRFEDLIPIPITPEILERCGFEKRWCNFSTINDFCYYKTNDDQSNFLVKDENEWEYCIEMFGYGHDGYVSVKIKYLHELQNLIFALTREELEIKEHVK